MLNLLCISAFFVIGMGDNSSAATNFTISTEPKLTFLSFCFGVGVL